MKADLGIIVRPRCKIVRQSAALKHTVFTLRYAVTVHCASGLYVKRSRVFNMNVDTPPLPKY